MSARKITVTVECCDVATGDMDITVEDPDNPDEDFRYQDMMLHPATCHLLHDLLGRYVTEGISLLGSHNLNNPEVLT